MDLIDREALLEKLENKEIVRLDKNGLCDIDEVLSIVRYGVPTVDAVTVVHGHWIDGFDTDGILIDYDCSVCNMANDDKTEYCPNCGAKMLGGK